MSKVNLTKSLSLYFHGRSLSLLESDCIVVTMVRLARINEAEYSVEN